jgi:hypothetical protein
MKPIRQIAVVATFTAIPAALPAFAQKVFYVRTPKPIVAEG